MIERDLLGNDHGNKQAHSPNKHPKRHSQQNLHLHQVQAEYIESHSHYIVPDGHKIPQSVNLLLRHHPPHTAQLLHDHHDIVNLESTAHSHHEETEQAQAEKLLKDGLTEDVVGETEFLRDLGI